MVRRDIVDTLLRGLDNTIANWPVILIRLGENIILGLIAIASALGMIVPLLISVGIRFSDVKTAEEAIDAASRLLTQWTLLVWVFLVASVVLLMFVLVHSFVVAGCARIAIDGDRAAGPLRAGPRTRFAMFSAQRWLDGGKAGWWTIFSIYNLAWGAAAIVLLIPLLPTLVLLLLVIDRENPAASIAIGCGGIALTLLLGIVVAVVTSVWCNRAIASWAAEPSDARSTLRRAWQAVRADLARHALVALAIFVISSAGSAFFSSFSMFGALAEAIGRGGSMIGFATIPLRLAGWILSSAFSSAMATWFLCAYGALAVEQEQRSPV
jgi:hypothetical protein